MEQRMTAAKEAPSITLPYLNAAGAVSRIRADTHTYMREENDDQPLLSDYFSLLSLLSPLVHLVEG